MMEIAIGGLSANPDNSASATKHFYTTSGAKSAMAVQILKASTPNAGMSISGGYSEFRNRIVSPALQAVADYWQQVRADRIMPAWTDLLPSHLAPQLKLLWFFNYDRAKSEFTARLAGNRAMMGFGRSFRGTPLRELHPPHLFELSQAHMTKVVSQPAAYHCSGKLFKVGLQIIEGERIMLPLASDGRHGDGVLGATDFPMRPAQGPIELLVGEIGWFSI